MLKIPTILLLTAVLTPALAFALDEDECKVEGSLAAQCVELMREAASHADPFMKERARTAALRARAWEAESLQQLQAQTAALRPLPYSISASALERLGVKGAPMGSPPEVLRRVFRDASSWKCEGNPEYGGDGTCSAFETTYANVSGVHVSGTYIQGRLIRVTVLSTTSAYPSFVSALQAKFGPATKVANEIGQNAFGAKFERQVTTWILRPGGVVLATLRPSKIDDAAVVLSSDLETALRPAPTKDRKPDI